MVELFGSIFPGIGYAEGREIGESSSNGGFLIALDPKAFLPADALNYGVRRMTDHVKTSPVAEGFDYDTVLYPGEKESRTRQERRMKGIEIEDATWNLIQAAMREYGVSGP